MKITRNNFNVTSTRYSRNGLKVGNFVFTLTNVRFCVLSMLAILTEGGVRVCCIAVLGHFWCGVAVIFYFKVRYCGFQSPSGLR